VDEIDIALEGAWNRHWPRLRADARELRRRIQRMGRIVASRPLRAWCLVIRASDTRINDSTAVIDPSGAIERLEEHDVTIDAEGLRGLTAAVTIPWPGQPLWEAAPKLGVSIEFARRWMREGALRLMRHDPPQVHGIQSCKPIPIVWTPSPVDPCNVEARVPHEMWGTLWQKMARDLPDDFVVTARREPRFLRWRGREVFRGWDWVCEGRRPRMASDAPRRGMTSAEPSSNHCQRRCKYLYAPMPAWTLPAALGVDVAEAMRASDMKAGGWPPPDFEHGHFEYGHGDDDDRGRELERHVHLAPIGRGGRSFACKECWQVRTVTMTNASGWNDFVTLLTCGLLYGSEVKRPAEWSGLEQRLRPKHHRRRRVRSHKSRRDPVMMSATAWRDTA
jgi:hypothetical protein